MSRIKQARWCITVSPAHLSAQQDRTDKYWHKYTRTIPFANTLAAQADRLPRAPNLNIQFAQSVFNEFKNVMMYGNGAEALMADSGPPLTDMN